LGRNPANPLKILKDTWTGKNQSPQTVGKSVSEFLAELQTQIQEIRDYADDHADLSDASDNRDTLISITREQLTNIFRLVNSIVGCILSLRKNAPPTPLFTRKNRAAFLRHGVHR